MKIELILRPDGAFGVMYEDDDGKPVASLSTVNVLGMLDMARILAIRDLTLTPVPQASKSESESEEKES